MPSVQRSHLAPSPRHPNSHIFLFLLLLSMAPPVFFPHSSHFGSSSVAAFPHAAAGSVCPPCLCDCSLELPPSPDCIKSEPNIQQLDKYSADLLSEELKLQAAIADESQQRADAALLEVKRLSSQYQKEADKCNFGIQTCEEARENAEEALRKQRKMTQKWEERARELGWRNEKSGGSEETVTR